MAKNFKKKDPSREDSFEFKKKKSTFEGKSGNEKKFTKDSKTGKPRFFSKEKPSFFKKTSADSKGKFSSQGSFNKEKKFGSTPFKKRDTDVTGPGSRGTFGAKAGKTESTRNYSDKPKSSSPRKFDREQKGNSSAKPDFKKKNSSYNDYRKKGNAAQSAFGSKDKNFKPKTWEKKPSTGKFSENIKSDSPKKFNRDDKTSLPTKGKFGNEKRFSKPSATDSKFKSFEKKNPQSFSKDNYKKPFKSKPEANEGRERKFNPADKTPFKKKTKNEDEFQKKILENFSPASEETKKVSNASIKTEANSSDKTSETLRLNRYISNAGICSRRDADAMIKEGMIKVNGAVVTEMGFQVKPGDVVKYGNRILNPEKQVYILLNKPKDFITTMDDPGDRKTVMDLVKNACKERIYPVGRLDRNTTGLLLLTNDGELADKLTHPSNEIKKIYQVELDKPITEEDFEKIQQGLTLEDGPVQVDDVAIVSSDRQILGMEIHVGRNRIVRRIFEHLGYEVVQLDRVMYAGLSKKDLPRGKWRFLTEKELIKLRYFV